MESASPQETEIDEKNLHQEEMPFALVQGQPVTEVPHDQNIPPDPPEVNLEAYEGPLHLQLKQIRRHNLDIQYIPITENTEK